MDSAFIGRSWIRGGALDATQETDGINLELGGFGAGYPDDLLFGQDGTTEEGWQNF